MIRADQIPPEVVEALAAAWRDEMNSAHALAAALSAWPSMRVDDTYRWLSDVAIILPMEDKNAES